MPCISAGHAADSANSSCPAPLTSFLSTPVQTNMTTQVQVKSINPLLAKYLVSLATRPLLTKACTSGALSFIQELLAGKLAGATPPPLSAKESIGVPPLDWCVRNQRAFKLALYGFFVSAPLAHTLTGRLQQAFVGRTTGKDKILQILAQLVLIAPITSVAYLASLAIIAGARSYESIAGAVKGSFWKLIRLQAIISPTSLTVAQNFISPELWVPWFNLVAFGAGTFINVQVKKKQGLIAKAKKDADASDKAQ